MSRPECLFRLASNSNTTEQKKRLQEGEDVNQEDMSWFGFGRTALYGACCGGVSDDVLDLVLSYSPRMDVGNDDGYTALHQACFSERLGAVQRLVTAGASLEVKDNDGNTPLHKAAGSANSDVVDVLLQAGADVHAVNTLGCTPLHWACVIANITTLWSHQPLSSFLPVAQLLCDNGADVNARNNEGRTPLFELLRASKDKKDTSRDFSESSILSVVQLLCSYGADPYLCDMTGRNAVTVAESEGCVDILNVFKLCTFIFY